MNLKKLIVFLVLSLFCIPTGFVFAEDENKNVLEIDAGKNLEFDFREFRKDIITGEDLNNEWYDKNTVYNNVNIGAGTKVVLDSEWQYVFVSSEKVTNPIPENREITVVGSTEPITVQDLVYVTSCTYRKDEIIATLSVNDNGKIILNAGSELSIRNQYSLINSTHDVSLEYEEVETAEHEKKVVFKEAHLSNMDSAVLYDGSYINRTIKDGDTDIFTGEIVFENGDADTTLTFQKVSEKESKRYVLPSAGEDVIVSGSEEEGFVKERGQIFDISEGMIANNTNIVSMANDLKINSNRAVLNVVGGDEREAGTEINETSRQVILGKVGGSFLRGDGTIVKKGEGALTLSNNLLTNKYVDGSGLTGANTGYAWRIEEGIVCAQVQRNLGEAAIYIDSNGTLGLGDSDGYVVSPKTIISEIKDGSFSDKTNKFKNNITSANGEISIVSGSQVELDGIIDTVGNNKNLRLTFYKDSALVLNKANTAENFIVNFGGKYGGEANYLITNVDGLASNSINANNTTDEEKKEFAFFELILNEASDKTYSGSLNGEMYLHKLGTGTVTLSGNNTFTEGTYITEGGLLLATSDSLGTGKIMFDSEDTSNYASIGAVSANSGDEDSEATFNEVFLKNNIHVKKGAILDVMKNQNLYLQGDLVCYDPNVGAEFIKNGVGNAIISQIEGVDRKINISTFTVTEGGFILDKGVASDSYFSLDGQQAFLEVRENAEIKNNAIDINNGDLIIFNEKCISSATAVNFNNEIASSTDSFSKFHIVSDAVLSNETIKVSSITVKQNIEFVTDATTTAKMNMFDFAAGNNKTIVKSGTGTFIADNEGSSSAFVLNSLYISSGVFKLENMDMEVSSETFVSNGTLYVSSTSHFASKASNDSDKKITILDGGNIGIYDGFSIDTHTALNFEGTDENNLSKLIIESSGVALGNSITVKAGIDIQNEQDFSFVGRAISFDPDYAGILAKSGEGTMTIDLQADNTTQETTFKMGEIRALGGNLLVKSNIDVSTISISGEGAFLSFEDVNNASITNTLSLASGGTLSVSTSTLNLSQGNLEMVSGNIINNNSNIKANIIDCSDSFIDLLNDTSIMEANTINLNNTELKGFGNLVATVNVKDNSKVYVGSHGTTGEKLKAKNVAFETGSELYIDIDDETGVSDKLEVLGNITVQKDVTLNVNFIGNAADDDSGASDINLADGKSKGFEFLTFTGSYNFTNPTNEIFNIVLSDSRLSASTSLIGKSIFLEIAQKFDLYDIPGATKNQKEMIDLFNEISSDKVESMKTLIQTLDGYFDIYLNTGNKSVFLNALQDLSGIFYANSFMTSAMLSKANILYNRLNETPYEREEKNRIWAQLYTNNFSVSENDENPEFKNSIYGIIAGYDTVQDESLTFGVAGFYGQGEFKQLDDKADIVDAGVNIYGDYKVDENIDVKGLIGYSMQDYDTTRSLRFNKQEITSKYATNTISLDLEAAYKYELGTKFLLKPLVGANCAIVSNGDIEEDGNTIQRLKIKKGSHSRAEVRVGVGLQGVSDSPFNWHAAAAIKHIISGSKFKTKSYFAEAPGYEFEIESTEVAGTSFSGLFGCSYDITPVINISLDLSADAGAVSQFGGNIGASYKW